MAGDKATPRQRTVRGKLFWVVDLRHRNAGRHFFKIQQEAEDFSLAKMTELDKFGTALEMTASDRVVFAAAKQKLDAVGATITQAVDFFIAHNHNLEPKKLQPAIDEFIEGKQRANKRPNYIRLLCTTLRSLAAEFEDVYCHEVTRANIESWLQGGGWGLVCQKGYLGNVRLFFGWCRKRGYARLNPAEGIERITPDERPPVVLSVSDCEALLRQCLEVDRGLIPFVAVQLFGGLRAGEARKLTWAEIGDGHIEITADKAKTRRRRLVTINPTLKAWLDLGGDLPAKNFRRRFWRVRYKVESVTKRGRKTWKPLIPWEEHCLRHSFCSYALTSWKDAARVALEAGHTEQILFTKYRELVTLKNSEKFWNLLPSAVQLE